MTLGKRLFSVVVGLFLWSSQAAAVPALPVLGSNLEEGVVVSITSVSLDAPFIDDPDRVPTEDGAFQAMGGPLGVPSTGSKQRRNLASGFIVSAEGHILTSAHAVAGGRAMTVRLSDGREFEGVLLGFDEASDVALLKIEGEALPHARIGDSRDLAVGDWVLAIGAPFGFESSVTAGIVSAKRLMTGARGVAYIQTDVAINPGSSGSPLFNLRGEVVGMNSMVYTSSGGYMGVSFALPVEEAMNVGEQIRKAGRVVRGQLGLGVQEVTLGLARAFGLPRAAGAIVIRVLPAGPAERAGLRIGDIILGLDDRSEMSYAEIQQAISAKAPGATVALSLWREGARRKSVLAVVGGRPLPGSLPAPELGVVDGDRLGLVLAEGYGGNRLATGQEVRLEVRGASGAAFRAGVEVGDRIRAVNDTAVRRLGDYIAALSQLAPGGHVALLVERDGNLRFIALGPVR